MRLTVPIPIFSRGRAARSSTPTLAVPLPSRNGADDDETLFNEDLLGRLRRLTLISRKSIAEGLAGEHRSRRRGSSPEFADFKSYSQGDDFRRIDWNIYGRLDEVFVRLSEVTTELTVHVLLDASNSMDWRSDERLPTKFTYARRFAGSLCYISLWHFDRVVIVPFGTELGTAFGPAQGHAHVTPMLHYLTNLQPLGATDLVSTLDHYVRARRRPGILVLVSDLLSGEPAELKEALRVLRGRGWQAIIAHVVDSAELAPREIIAEEPSGRSRPAELVEIELGDRLRLTPTQQVLARYESAVKDWLSQIERVCEEEDADYLRLETSWPFETIVLRMLYRQGVLE
ncbi:MAG: DUF58 domain-containing protein [Thermomicrobiales bacterium]